MFRPGPAGRSFVTLRLLCLSGSSDFSPRKGRVYCLCRPFRSSKRESPPKAQFKWALNRLEQVGREKVLGLLGACLLPGLTAFFRKTRSKLLQTQSPKPLLPAFSDLTEVLAPRWIFSLLVSPLIFFLLTLNEVMGPKPYLSRWGRQGTHGARLLCP